MFTTAPLEDLASYVPALILRRMAADVGATMSPSVERFPAAALVADLSGFTALTEQLSLHNPEGAEELTQILDLYFGHLVRVVTSHGGDVMKFAGDGLLALWYGDESLAQLTQRAVQCGLAVQMMMSPEMWGSFEGVRAPTSLKIRVGVGAGEVTTMHIGGIFGRWELLVTGEPIQQAGQAEGLATPGDVLIAAEAWPLVAEGCTGDALPSGGVRLVALAEYLPMRGLEVPPLRSDMADVLRSYLPKAILARIDAGQTAWLAEQRRVTVLFVNLPGLRADTPLRQAQALMRAIQSMLYRYEGSISRLGTDSKGPTLVAALGLPPLAHEDDPERGVRAALAISAALAELGFPCAIGVTTGQALCGAVGGEMRREYTMMGSIVNRSARLMQAAAVQAARDGGAAILCDATTAATVYQALRFERLPPMALKGVGEPVTVYRPESATAPTQGQAAPAQAGALIGRRRELALITHIVADLAEHGRGGVLLVEGDEGIGKTRLIAEVQAAAQAAGLPTFGGAGRPVDAAPYSAWRPIISALVPPDGLRDGSAWARDVLGEELEALLPLLGAVLQIDLADTAATARMPGQVRADKMRDLLVRLLALATEDGPLVITLEDAQWLDASSWALLQAVAERLDRLLLVVAARPMSDPPTAYQRLAYLPDTRRLQLGGLSPDQVEALLAQRLDVASVPPELWQLIADRSQGNPFFCEELLHALRDGGLVVVIDRECQVVAGDDDPISALNGVRLPSTVQGLITSRIDRLSPAQQLTLKVASVIGRAFTLSAISAIHPVERDPARLVNQLFTLQQAGLILIESFDPELMYIFRHAVAAEVAYNLMSFRQRRQLHRALAERYETLVPQLAANAGQLAYHWQQADEPERAMAYLALAGEQALRAGAYREAAGFMREAIQIADRLPTGVSMPDQVLRARWDRQLGEAYHGLGRLNESRELLERAAERLGCAAPERLRWTLPGMARELMRQALYALGQQTRWHRQPTAAREPSEQLSEAARIYMLLSQLAYYNSELPDAIYAALRSLSLAERTGETPELAGAYATAHLAVGLLPPLARFYRWRAQRLAHQIGHLPTHLWLAEAQGIAYAGRGDWRRAGGALTFALAIAERLGDQRRRAECRAMLALRNIYQGDFAGALARYAELYAAGQAAGDVQVSTWGLIGQAESLLHMGENVRAATLIDAAVGLLAENLGSTRAEEIWAYALRAKAALRAGQIDLAGMLASTVLDLAGRLPPGAVYALGGYTAVAEVFVELWERGGDGVAARQAALLLGRVALIFPLMRPTALIWSGRYAWGSQQHERARRRWQRAAALAARMGMPYEQGRALAELGGRAAGTERERLLGQAQAIFCQLGAPHDLARVTSYE